MTIRRAQDDTSAFYTTINPSDPGEWLIFCESYRKGASVGSIRYEKVIREGREEKVWVAKMFLLTEEGDTPQKALKALIKRGNTFFKTSWKVTTKR